MPEKMDRLCSVINDAVGMPWLDWQRGTRDHWGLVEQFLDFDTDLTDVNPLAAALDLTDRLQDLRHDQVDAVARLLVLAIKVTRTVCLEPPPRRN
jgi:hypothetical protein